MSDQNYVVTETVLYPDDKTLPEYLAYVHGPFVNNRDNATRAMIAMAEKRLRLLRSAAADDAKYTINGKHGETIYMYKNAEQVREYQIRLCKSYK